MAINPLQRDFILLALLEAIKHRVKIRRARREHHAMCGDLHVLSNKRHITQLLLSVNTAITYYFYERNKCECECVAVLTFS